MHFPFAALVSRAVAVTIRRRSAGGLLRCRLALEQLIVEQSQVFPLHLAASLDTIGVQRADHDALAPWVSQHLRNSVAVPHQRAALGTRLQQEADAGADTFGARHG